MSGDILFTIRISVDPLATLTQHAEVATIATALIEQLEALSPEQARYKGLWHDREVLVKRLRAMAG